MNCPFFAGAYALDGKAYVMTKSEENLADLEFIINELNRQSTWSFPKFKQHWELHPEDKYDVLPLGNGSHICTNAAVGKRFRDLADRNSEADRERYSYDRRSYVDELKTQFVHDFIELHRPLDQRTSDRLVGKALANLKMRLTTRTHYLPCVVTGRQTPNKFKIGDVTFYSQSGFSERLDREVDAYFQNQRHEIEKKWRERQRKSEEATIESNQTLEARLSSQQWMEDRFRSFFQSLGWVAEVTVPTCLPDISCTRANETVSAALDVLKLFLGEKNGHNLHVAYDRGLVRSTVELSRITGGEISIAWTRFVDGALVDENWFEQLEQKYPLELQIAGRSINRSLNPNPTNSISEKWLGALLWYGQGVSETAYSAKIVKYVSALEQLTITRNSADQHIGALVTARTRFLSGPILEEDGVGNTGEVIERLYRVRCDLLHGRVLPTDPKVQKAANQSGRVVQSAVFNAIRFFLHVINQRGDSLESLEHAFQESVH
jgi:hypothetical protein